MTIDIVCPKCYHLKHGEGICPNCGQPLGAIFLTATELKKEVENIFRYHTCIGIEKGSVNTPLINFKFTTAGFHLKQLQKVAKLLNVKDVTYKIHSCSGEYIIRLVPQNTGTLYRGVPIDFEE
jgi:predicted amidophosphoribosyltransferase